MDIKIPKQHTTHNKQRPIPQRSQQTERPQNYTLDRTATGNDTNRLVSVGQQLSAVTHHTSTADRQLMWHMRLGLDM
jgi:hypothetical protein